MFIIDKGLYYYRVRPFGLKNKGAIYQNFQHGIQGKIGSTVETYLDDVVIKSFVRILYIPIK